MDEHDEEESQVSSDSNEGDSSSLAELATKISSTTPATDRSREETLTDHATDADETSQELSLSELAKSVREKRVDSGDHAERDPPSTTWEFADDSTPSEAEVELDAEAVAVIDRLEDETNVLVVGPSESAMARAVCKRLMLPTSPSAPTRQLVVSVDTSSDKQRQQLQTIRNSSVESQVLIDAQSYSASNSVEEYDELVSVQTVTTPGDLRRIGILTTKVLTEWADDAIPSAVCVHTLSALLDAVDDPERVFRFVHILHGRIRSADARGFFYLDPTRQDQQTVRTFFSLFDTILEFDSDGTVTLL
ncbi:hypothetical protein [Haloferax sp. DFSO52]|uniref:DUF7504 family protein n=1 Tax=Haloferax sp. DFSO52 TaxID=3388505 RepID=UPI003A861414